LKILHVITTINRGGTENHLAELVTGQRAHGHEVAVAYMKGNGYWRAYFESLGVEVFCLEMPSYFRPTGLLRLHRVVQKVKPDLLHAHMPPSSLLCRALLLLPRYHRLKFFVSVHTNAPFIETRKIEAFRTWVYGRASEIICISEAVREYAEKLSPTSVQKKLSKIYYGMLPPALPSEAEREKVRASFGAAENTLVIGTVSRLSPEKGLDSLLQAFQLFRERNAMDCRLLIVGSGRLEAELKKLSRDLGLERFVTWVPYTEQVFSWMAAMDIFVLNSTYEGFGLVLLEAMAVARPIVGSTAGAIPEVVRDGETGFIVRDRAPLKLTEKFEKLIDGSLRQRLGDAGRQRLETAFSREKMVADTLAAYESASVLS